MDSPPIYLIYMASADYPSSHVLVQSVVSPIPIPSQAYLVVGGVRYLYRSRATIHLQVRNSLATIHQCHPGIGGWFSPIYSVAYCIGKRERMVVRPLSIQEGMVEEFMW